MHVKTPWHVHKGLFGAAFAWLIRKKRGISPPNAARWTRVSRPPAHRLSGICTALVRIERSGPRSALAYLSRAFVTRAPKQGLSRYECQEWRTNYQCCYYSNSVSTFHSWPPALCGHQIYKLVSCEKRDKVHLNELIFLFVSCILPLKRLGEDF